MCTTRFTPAPAAALTISSVALTLMSSAFFLSPPKAPAQWNTYFTSTKACLSSF